MKNITVSGEQVQPPGRVKKLVTATALVGATASGMQSLPAFSAQLEETLVTATRRTETDIQTTPIAITALTSNDIEELVPQDLGDISAQVPNFIAGKQPGFKAAAFAMRGVGTTSIIVYQDAQVGVTVDDFVLPSVQTQNMEMFDIEQIEVLRGPQGTLFGKNTTGGVINVKTKRPQLDETTVELQGKVAQHGRYEGRYAINHGTDTLAFRGAGVYMKSDGYYENGASYGPVAPFSPNAPFAGATGKGNGNDVGGDDSFSSRFKLLWQPNEDFTALAQYELIRDDGDSPPSVNTSPVGAPLTFNALGLGKDKGDPLKNAAVTNRNRDDALLHMSDGHQVDIDGYYLNMDWSIGDYTISSVTGYREQDSELPNTYTGEVGPNSLFDANRQDQRETFQQELRVASDFSGPLNFVGGGFYQTDDTTFCVNQVLGFLDLFGLGFDNFGDPNFFNNNPQVLCNEQEAENYAFFGDFTYDFAERWSFGGGARWTKEEKDWTGRNQVFYQQLEGGFDPNLTWQDFNEPLGAAKFNKYSTGVFKDSKSWDEPTYRATVSYEASDDLFTYFTYSHGFKSGSYNDQTGTSGVAITPESAAPTDPEKADSYELGFKADLFQNSARLDVAAFYVEYSDAQRDLVASFENEFGVEFQETRFFNAADMEVYGLEVQFTAAITDNFTLRGNGSYLHSEYNKFVADTNDDGVDDVDLSNADVNRAPEYQWNLDAIYEHDLFGGNMRWLLNANYTDESIFVYSVLGPQYDGMTDDVTLLNASITYTAQDGKYFVRAYGKNLTDETYRIGELPVADLWTFAYYGEPQTFGLEFGVNFDL